MGRSWCRVWESRLIRFSCLKSLTWRLTVCGRPCVISLSNNCFRLKLLCYYVITPRTKGVKIKISIERRRTTSAQRRRQRRHACWTQLEKKQTWRVFVVLCFSTPLVNCYTFFSLLTHIFTHNWHVSEFIISVPCLEKQTVCVPWRKLHLENVRHSFKWS